MQDKFLRQRIVDELDFNPSINAANIGISVDGGVVTLTGHVSSYAERLAAEEATRRMKGVRGIAQEIEIRYPSHKKSSDDEIAKRALSIIQWHAMLPEDAVQVIVRRGLITLTGEVTWQYQKKAAEDAVQKLSGVTGVINNISLEPHVAASDIKKKIEDALTRRAQIEANTIQIDVLDGNKVKIAGSVECWEQREAVEDAVWSVGGVQSIDDRLTVS